MKYVDYTANPWMRWEYDEYRGLDFGLGLWSLFARAAESSSERSSKTKVPSPKTKEISENRIVLSEASPRKREFVA